MSILINPNTRILIQGSAEHEGDIYTNKLLLENELVVGGVTPGKGGAWKHGKPLFETVYNAVEATGANTSVILVPPLRAADAIYEAIDSNIQLIICITEGIPLLDAVQVREYIRDTPSRLIGPNCSGLLTPRLGSVGLIPLVITTPGNIGIVSRSSSLASEVTYRLTASHLGQSTIAAIGSDAVLGTNFVDILRLFEDDTETNTVILLGEVGGYLENDAAAFIHTQMTKPVIAYVAGQHLDTSNLSPYSNTALNADAATTAQAKITALMNAGARIANSIDAIFTLL